jgi:hypothetical protein
MAAEQDGGDVAARRARRAWIAAHHPDRGGDPAVFTAGLTRVDADQAAVRVSVCRSPSPVVRGRRMLRRLRRRRSRPQHGRVV